MNKMKLLALGFLTIAFTFTACDKGCDENEIQCQAPDGTRYCCDAPWQGRSSSAEESNETNQ